MTHDNPTENTVKLVAYVGDVQIRPLPRGGVVTEILAYTKYAYEHGGETVVETTRHRLAGFGRNIVATARKLKRGALIEAHGRLREESWQDAQSGQTRYATKIVLSDLVIRRDSTPEREWREAPRVRR